METRHDFIIWLKKNFPFLTKKPHSFNRNDVILVEEKGDEIIRILQTVFNKRFLKKSSYGDYYKNDLEKIYKAYKSRDYDSLSEAIYELKCSIEWE